MEKAKKEVRKRTEQLVRMKLHDDSLTTAINCRLIPVAAYVMNIRNLQEQDEQ